MNRYDKTNIFIHQIFFTVIRVIGRSDCKQMECGLTSFYYFFIPTLLLDKTSKNKIKFPKGASGEAWHIKVPNPSVPQPIFNFYFNIFEGPGNPWICPGPYMVRSVKDFMAVWSDSDMVDTVLDISNHIGPCYQIGPFGTLSDRMELYRKVWDHFISSQCQGT